MGSSSKIHGVWSVLQAPAAAQEKQVVGLSVRREINATIYLEQFATHQESSETKAGTISGYPRSSTAPEGLDLYRNLQKNSAAREEGRGCAHPQPCQGCSSTNLPLTSLTFPARFLSSSLLLTSLIRSVRSSAIVN